MAACSEPLSDQELDDKLADLAARGGTGCDPVSLTAAIHALEEFSDMGETHAIGETANEVRILSSTMRVGAD